MALGQAPETDLGSILSVLICSTHLFEVSLETIEHRTFYETSIAIAGAGGAGRARRGGVVRAHSGCYYICPLLLSMLFLTDAIVS